MIGGCGRGCVGVGDRGTQRDSRSVPKRRLDDVCAPKRQRGRTLKVSLRTDGFVPVLHLQGDVAMAVNALSGMEGVRARSPVGSSLLLSRRNPHPSPSTICGLRACICGGDVLFGCESFGSPRARWRASGHVWWPRAVPCVRGFCCHFLVLMFLFFFFYWWGSTAVFRSW